MVRMIKKITMIRAILGSMTLHDRHSRSNVINLHLEPPPKRPGRFKPVPSFFCTFARDIYRFGLLIILHSLSTL